MTAELKSSLVTSLEAAAARPASRSSPSPRAPTFTASLPRSSSLACPAPRPRPLAEAGAERGLRLRQAEPAARDDGSPGRRGQAPAQSAPRVLRHAGRAAAGLRPFEWPFHHSTSGADTYIVHGEMHLADGGAHNLHAKVAASVTLTFAEIVPAMEQPYAETFVYNAVRKTVDMGQLEFVKSGNRQPVPVTTRYYSRWQKKFVFTETDDAGAAPLPAEQGLLAVRRSGREQAGVDRRSARRAIPEHHRSRSAAHGRRRSRRGADGARRRVCRGHSRAHGARRRVPGRARSRPRLHQAAVQRVACAPATRICRSQCPEHSAASGLQTSAAI